MVKIFDNVVAYVVNGDLSRITFGEPLGDVSAEKYKEVFQTSGAQEKFGRRVDDLYRLIFDDKESGTVVLADRDLRFRYGGGFGSLLTHGTSRRLCATLRNETATEEKNKVDILAGKGDDADILGRLLREGIEEILAYTNNISDDGSEIANFFVPQFSEESGLSAYNDIIYRKITDYRETLGFSSIFPVPCASSLYPLDNSTRIETPYNKFSANVAFEPQSIELILMRCTEVPINLKDLILIDAETRPDGTLWKRRSFFADPESGSLDVFRNGSKEYSGTLSQYLNNFDPTAERYSTVKIAGLVENIPASFGNKSGLMPLTKGFDPKTLKMPRVR